MKNDSSLFKEHISAIPFWNGSISNKNHATFNHSHHTPWKTFEDFSISNLFPMLQIKITLKGLCLWAILSSSAASRTLQEPNHTLLLKLGSCPMKGLAFLHCSSISIASKENLCRERRDLCSFYNRANCLRLPHSVKYLLCCFTTEQEAKGQRGPTAEEMLSFIYSPQANIPVGDYCFPVFFLFLQETDTR